ncbi:VOC family protein [Gaetbulibacter sp. M235]|uniref:VOC family protein n=1 Tax=Gaetbulibacter sp. M235 TaxID=3126510 RepID=UPI00374EB1EC
MVIEHVAIWTKNIERLKDYYSEYFSGEANEKHSNSKNQFESYFLSFQSGSRLEIMSMIGIPENLNDRVCKQHLGIIHLAFEVSSTNEVDEMAERLRRDAHEILSGPRITGDGYYEFETLDPDNNRIEVTTKV